MVLHPHAPLHFGAVQGQGRVGRQMLLTVTTPFSSTPRAFAPFCKMVGLRRALGNIADIICIPPSPHMYLGAAWLSVLSRAITTLTDTCLRVRWV